MKVHTKLPPLASPSSLVNGITKISFYSIFKKNSKRSTSTYIYIAYMIRTDRRSPSRTLRRSNLVIGKRSPPLYPSQPKYCFHLPLQPSSCLGGITQDHQSFIGSSPGPPLFWHQTCFTNYECRCLWIPRTINQTSIRKEALYHLKKLKPQSEVLLTLISKLRNGSITTPPPKNYYQILLNHPKGYCLSLLLT